MNKSDLTRNLFMLKGPLSKKGYDWWWHSFSGVCKETGKKRSFFIEYFIINPALGGDKPILGQANHNKENGIKPSYVMIKAGVWGEEAKQIHEFYPINALKIGKDNLSISVGKCYLSETHIYGKVSLEKEESENHPEYMCHEGNMYWDLMMTKKIAFHVGYGASKFFRKLNAFEMFWHAEGMKTEYSGKVIYNNEEYEILPESSYGYADKNWGCDYTSPWVWISSCNMKSVITGKSFLNSAIDIGGGKPKIFGIPLNRKLLIDFYYEGKDYEFNFSKFWTFTKTKFHCVETADEIRWTVKTENFNSALELYCSCKKEEMLFINYEAPDGSKKHNRLWNGGTGEGTLSLYKKKRGEKQLIDKIILKNIGCEYGEYNK